jgi:hypothetical protein
MSVVLAAVLVSATGSAQPPAQAAGSSWRTENVLPKWLLADRVGVADPDRRVDVDVLLADPRLGLARAYAAAVVDPAGGHYHRFLTPGQYASRFGVRAASRAAVEHWLAEGGLRVGGTVGAGDLLEASGTVAELQRLFRLRLGTYRSGPSTFLANDLPPAVPARLPIAAVIGLNDLQRFVVPHPARPAAARPGPALDRFSGQVDVRTLWRSYDAPPDDAGQGVSMGVFMSGNTVPVIGSLRIFEDAEALPRVPVRVVHDQPGPAQDFAANTGAAEWMLDTQASTGMAPKVRSLALYTAKSLSDADLAAGFAYWAADPNGPTLMSASLGSCEAFPVFSDTGRGEFDVKVGNDVQDAVERSLLQAFTEGRTLFAASGDTGSSCPAVGPVARVAGRDVDEPVPARDYPAASPWDTAVGGTVLAFGEHGVRAAEQAWASGGGGPALFIPEPVWQRGEAHVNTGCLVTDHDGVPLPAGTICRGVPDVAALSGNGEQAFSVRTYDGPDSESGTSVSSPLMMGMWARVVAAAHHPLGPAAPAIYRLTPAARARDFYDVTAGEAAGNGLYFPGPGWDYTTGYGVPDIAALTTDLAGSTSPVDSPSPPAVPDPATGDAVACLPFGTSPVGNVAVSALGDPGTSRDITSAAMTLTPDGRSLAITVRGPQLGPKVPLTSAATTMTVQWIYHDRTYQARTSADTSGNLTGELTATTNTRQAAPVDNPAEPVENPAGPVAFTAAYGPGRLTMRIPLTDIGSPPAGARLRYPVALSGTDSGVDDVAGPTDDYTVAQHCTGPAPP